MTRQVASKSDVGPAHYPVIVREFSKVDMNPTHATRAEAVDLAHAAAQTDGRPPWCSRGLLVFFFRELNDQDLNEHLALGLLEVKYGGPPEEFGARVDFFLRQVTPSNARLGRYLSARVSEVFAKYPELLQVMTEKGFRPGDRHDEGWIFGALVGNLARCFVANLLAVGQQVVGDAAIGIVDEAIERAWSDTPAFWRAARRDVHSIAFHLTPEFTEALDRLLGAADFRGREGNTRQAVARHEAWADALSCLFEQVEEDRPTNIGASMAERIDAIRRGALNEQHAREFKRGSASWSRTDARRSSFRARPAALKSALLNAHAAVDPAHDAQGREALAAIVGALAEPRERAVFEAVILEKLPYAVAAKRLGMSDKTVKAWETRILRKLSRFDPSKLR